MMSDHSCGICIGWGQVRHARLRPAAHRFAYPTAFLWLPMRHLRSQPQAAKTAAFAINRHAWHSFYDLDHGDGRPPEQGGALQWFDELLHSQGIEDAQGEVWLQTLPRVAGRTFKPVSFWYAHRLDGSLAAIVAEVNNTFGERHCYLLPSPQWGVIMQAKKVFHVSPFCSLQGQYRFRFMRSQQHGRQRVIARVDYDDEHGPLLTTSLSGELEPATQHAVRQLVWRFPLLSLAVVARIHWQALRLWLKRNRYFSKPPPPKNFVSQAQPR